MRVRNAPFCFSKTFGSTLSASKPAETKVRNLDGYSVSRMSFRTGPTRLFYRSFAVLGNRLSRVHPGIPGKRFDHTYDGNVKRLNRPIRTASVVSDGMSCVRKNHGRSKWTETGFKLDRFTFDATFPDNAARFSGPDDIPKLRFKVRVTAFARKRPSSKSVGCDR